ncbi:hypothetical protein M0802_001788 [Mischocyttarus mexicanus]|nr:hypothetical protein M0802_001788 [Mischocyttarus mexicanus]
MTGTYKPRRRKRSRRKKRFENYFDHDDFGDSSNSLTTSFKHKQNSNKTLSNNIDLMLGNKLSMLKIDDGETTIKKKKVCAINEKSSLLQYKVIKNNYLLKLQAEHGTKNIKLYEISISDVAEYTKDCILQSLRSIISVPFVPIMYKTIGRDVIFCVDNIKVGAALNNCNGKIMTSGYKLKVNMKIINPQCKINDALKERIKKAMVKRYDKKTNTLDLSQFSYDPDLVTDYFCPLTISIIMRTVLNIIGEHLPMVETLNLGGNNLKKIEKLNLLHIKFPKLKTLYLENNKISEITQLNTIKELQLEELKLTGNPLATRYIGRRNDYIRLIRIKFPKLMKLDGMELSPAIFKGDNDTKGEDIANRFLKEYFYIFDSENRQPLINAYTEHAYFFLSTNTLTNNTKLNYLAEDRNLFETNDPNKEQKLLMEDRLKILDFITQLPRTKHHFNTFIININAKWKKMITIHIKGLFNEINGPLYQFVRIFTIVSKGRDYCICIEKFHISPSTEEQQKIFLHNNFLKQQISTVPSGSTSRSLSEVQSVQLPEDVKQQMIKTINQQTNMNLTWSQKCLEDVNWNYEKAIVAFQNAFKLNKIPQEAYVN